MSLAGAVGVISHDRLGRLPHRYDRAADAASSRDGTPAPVSRAQPIVSSRFAAYCSERSPPAFLLNLGFRLRSPYGEPTLSFAGIEFRRGTTAI